LRHGNMVFFSGGLHRLDDLLVSFLCLGVEDVGKLFGFTPSGKCLWEVL
jgi:hypothetical protein